MSLKQKALLQTVGIFALILGSTALLQLAITNMDLQTIQYILGAGVLGFFGYVMYGIVLARLQSQEILDKMNTKV